MRWIDRPGRRTIFVPRHARPGRVTAITKRVDLRSGNAYGPALDVRDISRAQADREWEEARARGLRQSN